MGNLKGTALQEIKKNLKSLQLEDTFVSQLSPEAALAYRTAMPVSWVPVQEAMEIIESAAAAIRPDDPKGIYQIAYDSARASIPVIYRMFIQIPTPRFVISKAPSIWGTYMDIGNLMVEELTDSSVIFKLVNGGSLPQSLREFCRGYCHGIMSLTNAKELQVNDLGVSNGDWRLNPTWKNS